MTRATVRREVRIARPPDEVWSVIGDPGRVHEWFPGVETCVVEGTTRTVTTASGLPIPEELVTVDAVQRRFQYRIAAPFLHEHLATVDVLDAGDGTSLVVYGTDADPATMALVLGGAAGAAIENLRRNLEGAG
jgi:hypothetical protein